MHDYNVLCNLHKQYVLRLRIHTNVTDMRILYCVQQSRAGIFFFWLFFSFVFVVDASVLIGIHVGGI